MTQVHIVEWPGRGRFIGGRDINETSSNIFLRPDPLDALRY
jgi:hypothetical protein